MSIRPTDTPASIDLPTVSDAALVVEGLMSKSERRWPLAEALGVAQELVGLLSPACERIVIAGSCRRLKPNVGDIELLCVPKPSDSLLFTDEVDRVLKTELRGGSLYYRPNIKGKFTYGPLNKLLIHRASGIPVDIFSTTEKNWGMALVRTTGPAEFNIRMMARFKQLGMAGHAYGGITTPSGEVDCPDEETVFKVLGWPYAAPEDRR